MNKRLFILLAGFSLSCRSQPATTTRNRSFDRRTDHHLRIRHARSRLNMVDNLPVVAIVKSEAGLKSVSLSINTSDGETVPVTTVTEFFNAKSYSLAEDINYEPNYTEAVIEAVDLLGRKAEAKMPISIVDVVEAPRSSSRLQNGRMTRPSAAKSPAHTSK
ncbi:MAG: hypothetical protein ACLSHL_09860 [Alistipes communis]